MHFSVMIFILDPLSGYTGFNPSRFDNPKFRNKSRFGNPEISIDLVANINTF